jgi:predicted HTH transcriptional regulator
MRHEAAGEASKLTYGTAEKILLSHLEKTERVTLKEFCRLANIGRWRAQRILVNLVRMGVVKVICTEKAEFYSL